LADLIRQLLDQIETGRLEEANRTSRLIHSLGRDPSICNRESLAGLKKAWTLAIVQRSHIQRRLRSLAASRLYRPAVDTDRRTFQLEG
jgi:hypothetical protein